MLNRSFLVGCLAALLGTNALGHTVWIEPLEKNLVIRFAEPGDDFETSPGHLDSLSAPASFVLRTNTPVALETPVRKDHFALPGTSPGEVVCTESIFTVRGGRKPFFYARWHPAEAPAGKPRLTLDLVPTGKPGEVRAYLRGEPLAGAKAFLRTPDGNEQELKSDRDGFIRFQVSEPGHYLLTLPHHREPIPGFYLGRSYQETSHNSALSWVQP